MGCRNHRTNSGSTHCLDERGWSVAGGTVTFDPVSDATSKVKLRLEYEPQGLLENIGDAAGFVNRRVEGDFERFKEYI
jgi:uncharacterized membrane protein